MRRYARLAAAMQAPGRGIAQDHAPIDTNAEDVVRDATEHRDIIRGAVKFLRVRFGGDNPGKRAAPVHATHT